MPPILYYSSLLIAAQFMQRIAIQILEIGRRNRSLILNWQLAQSLDTRIILPTLLKEVPIFHLNQHKHVQFSQALIPTRNPPECLAEAKGGFSGSKPPVYY